MQRQFASPEKNMPNLEDSHQRCQRSAGQMWNNLWCLRDFADVTLHSSEGIPIKLHKLALVVRSPVMKEAWTQPEVELIDGAPLEVAQFVRQFRHAVLKHFFLAVYTGSCDVLKDGHTEFHHLCTDIHRLALHFQVSYAFSLPWFFIFIRAEYKP